jgi:hypothetical protein
MIVSKTHDMQHHTVHQHDLHARAFATDSICKQAIDTYAADVCSTGQACMVARCLCVTVTHIWQSQHIHRCKLQLLNVI